MTSAWVFEMPEVMYLFPRLAVEVRFPPFERNTLEGWGTFDDPQSRARIGSSSYCFSSIPHKTRNG